MEVSILKWVDATFHSQTWLNYLMKYITYIGEFGLGAIIAAIVLFAIPKTRWGGFAAGIALVFDVLIVNVILKLSVNRPRPWTQFPEIAGFYESCGVRLPTDSSFPSGHTAACFCVAVALVFKYKLKGLPALAIAVLVAISRIYLCVHYPTDVLGGIVIGTACGVGGYYLEEYLHKLLNKRKSTRKAVSQNTLSREDIIGLMQDKELSYSGEILKIIYSTDKSRRYVILKTEKDFITYEYEELRFYDEEEMKYLKPDTLPAYWVERDVGKSIFKTLEDAEKQLLFEPEFTAYFKE